MPSQAEIEQYQADVEELSSLAVAAAVAAVVAAAAEGDDAESIVKAIPPLMEPYLSAAGQLAVDWYRGLARQSPRRRVRRAGAPDPILGPTGRIALLDAQDFIPRPTDLPPREQIEASVWRALAVPEPAKPAKPAEPQQARPAGTGRALSAEDSQLQAQVIDRLTGSVDRYVKNTARATIAENADREGVRWVRRARPDACAFCRLLATRSDYLSEESANVVVGRRGRPRGKRQLGEQYHDDCRCEAVPVRAGDDYQPDTHVADWDVQYRKAVAEVGDRRDVKAILKQMRALAVAEGGSPR